MTKDTNKKSEWAKLARKPGKASSDELGKALAELESEKSEMESRQTELENIISDLELDSMAGIEPSGDKSALGLDGAKAERQGLSDRLGAMEKATRLLQESRVAASRKEKEDRLAEIIEEISQMKALKRVHYEKGLENFAKGMAYLGSAMGFNSGNPQQGMRLIKNSIETRGTTFSADFAKAHEKTKKPTIHASSQSATLEKERSKIEKTLKVGAFEQHEQKELPPGMPPERLRTKGPPESMISGKSAMARRLAEEREAIGEIFLESV